MLFNRLCSFVALASLAAPILAAPLPIPGELEIEHGQFELEMECEKHKAEIELEIKPFKLLGLPIPVEVEIEIEIELGGAPAKLSCSTLGLDKRGGPFRSVAASVLAAQSKLDGLKPKIEAAMVGPIGSIEKKIGNLMWEVHSGVDALNVEINLFVGADRDVVYGNPSGGAQLTDTELAKIVSVYLLHIAQMEDTVQHVSGYKFTSAQQKIRQDLMSMKKTLGTISPEVLSGAANMMSMALSMGHGVMA